MTYIKKDPKKQFELKELQEKVQSQLWTNKPKWRLIAILVVAIIINLTVNLTKLVPSFGRNTKKKSRYTKLQRFFRFFSFDKEAYVKFMLSCVGWWSYHLTIDRTNWKFGEKNINILMIGIVHKGIAIPLVRKMLDKRGNSNSEERIELFEELLGILGKESILSLLADREFIWSKWLKYLKKKKIPYVVRIKHNMKIRWKHISKSFEHLAINTPLVFGKKCNMSWVRVQVAGMKIQDDYLILAYWWVEEAIELYAKRREIETLFGCLKGRWFNFEDTHITKQERISTMVAVLGICFVRAHLVWERLNEFDPIPIKKHGRKAYSLFRYGLDRLRDLFFNMPVPTSDFLLALEKL